MGLARKLSERLDLESLTPQSNLASTGYCLANPGQEYLVYKTREKNEKISINLKSGKYSIEWINPSNGKSHQAQDHQSKSDADSFTPPFRGPAILHLRKK
jgi:hypothetical protein